MERLVLGARDAISVLGCVEADSCKRIVNTKYSFESSWRDLQYLQTFAPCESSLKRFAPLRIQILSSIQMYSVKCLQTFSHVCSFIFKSSLSFCNCPTIVVQNSPILMFFRNFSNGHGKEFKISKSPQLFSNFLRFRNENCWIFRKLFSKSQK